MGNTRAWTASGTRRVFFSHARLGAPPWITCEKWICRKSLRGSDGRSLRLGPVAREKCGGVVDDGWQRQAGLGSARRSADARLLAAEL